MSKGEIVLRGVRVNNLKGVSVSIPRGQLVVLTGLSGSGKSSLAFGTLYAEGQRRYVQSLSAYARQFLGRLPKPDADEISGIPPAVMISQHVNTKSSVSTVGTFSETYDYLRLLFARVGRIVDPKTGEELRSNSTKDAIDYIFSCQGKRVVLQAPLAEQIQEAMGEAQKRLGLGKGTTSKAKALGVSIVLDRLALSGYSRVVVEGVTHEIEAPEARLEVSRLDGEFYLLIDRFVPDDSAEFRGRCGDSVELAFREGNGACRLSVERDGGWENKDFDTRILLDGEQFPPLRPELFSFNNPLGVCKTCNGYGKTLGISEELVVPDRSLSVFDGAVACWRGPVGQQYCGMFILAAARYDFPVHRPYSQLTQAQRQLLWKGDGEEVHGIDEYFAAMRSQYHKVQNRVMIAQYSGRAECPECHGQRLNHEALCVRVGGRNIAELVSMPIDELLPFVEQLQLQFDAREKSVSRRIMIELTTRLGCLLDVGLGYLTLDRQAKTLSGGETQRINLATALGSSLVGSLYILDEPTVGLHPVDTGRLIRVLLRLRDQGNTVVVVEHDEEIMRAADKLIDMGPRAGSGGGEVVFAGRVEELAGARGSLTADYLMGRKKIEVPPSRRDLRDFVLLKGASANNLQSVDVRVPLHALTVVTGMSGSGKSTLIRDVLLPSLDLYLAGDAVGYAHARSVELTGGSTLTGSMFIDQNTLTRSLRSTPITYTSAFGNVRSLFAMQPAAKERNLAERNFSFNDTVGVCPECQGLGRITVDMQFMSDVEMECEVCHGKRYNGDVLSVQYRGQSISDVLNMTVEDAEQFFMSDSASQAQQVASTLRVLREVGLGYVTLGQPTSTLSGGEAQRLKIASFLLDVPKGEHLLLAFDEPTTGLHFDDIKTLMGALGKLIEVGHTVVLIEHNVEVMKLADWLIDLGPGGGKHGGRVVAMGRPEEVARAEASVTGRFLSRVLGS